MAFPPPVPFRKYTPEERALIAGYLLHMRDGTLKAQDSVGSAPSGVSFGDFENTYQYWKHGEAYSRWLLYWIGYPVQRGKMYVPPTP